jgi:SagB-type dehydrogenase family enzyme
LGGVLRVSRTEPLIVAGGGYPAGNCWRFLSRGRIVEIADCNDLLLELLPLLNGTRCWNEISAVLARVPQDRLDELIGLLSEHDIIANPNRLVEVGLRYARNPPCFRPRITEDEVEELTRNRSHMPAYHGREHELSLLSSTVTDLLRARRSRRTFGASAPSARQVLHLCWSVCGALAAGQVGVQASASRAFTVPSGGALYATLVYLYLRKECGDLRPGFYFWNYDRNALQEVEIGRNPQFEATVLYAPQDFGDAAGLVILASCLDRVAAKYGNRAATLALLEAGHMMQNAYLFCAQERLGLVELAGFDDAACRRALKLDENTVPLVVGLFGT